MKVANCVVLVNCPPDAAQLYLVRPGEADKLMLWPTHGLALLAVMATCGSGCTVTVVVAELVQELMLLVAVTPMV